jgi:SAM-dependent methyltransferase
VKSLDSNVQFWGIDINLAAVEEAKPWMEEAVCINLDNINQLSCFLSGKTFDTIVAADVLEHTTNPWLVASHLLRCLEPKGRMVVSLPNLGHWEIYVHLFKQYFPRRQRGIFDNTHMRFFLANNLDEFSLEGFKVRIVQRNYRLFESGASQPWDHILSRLVRYIPWLREFFVFQWVFYIQADSSEQQ